MHPVILSAATKLFAEKGFEQPTMDEVAAAAGVQKPTLYAYFDGKSALVDAVISNLLLDLPVLRPTNKTAPLREQLVDVGLQLQELAAHSATVSLALGFAEQRLSVEQLTAWRTRHEEFKRFLVGILKHHCSCERPEQLAQLFLLLVSGDLRPVVTAAHVVDPERIEVAVDLLMRAYPRVPSLQTTPHY